MANLSIGQITSKIANHLTELSQLMRVFGEKLANSPDIGSGEKKSSSRRVSEFSFTEDELQTFEVIT